jgi:hypothetical protein
MRLDGLYRSPASGPTALYDWLQLHPDGVVLFARTGPRTELLAHWFGQGESAFADRIGTFIHKGERLTVQLDQQVHPAQLTATGLLLGDQAFERVSPAVPLPLPFAPTPSPKDLPMPLGLTGVHQRWWEFAAGKGWHCRRCDRVPRLDERECWLDCGYCTECAIEAFR